MGSDGTLAAPVTLTDRTLPVRNPTAVGLANGRSLLVYSRLMPGSGFGNHQVRFQILDSSPGDGGTVLDAGIDRATDGGDGGGVLADGSSAEAGSFFDGANPNDAVDASAAICEPTRSTVRSPTGQATPARFALAAVVRARSNPVAARAWRGSPWRWRS